MKKHFRADHIGSLQRPRALLNEVHRIYERGHTAMMAEERGKDLSPLHALEDEAAGRVLKKQEEIGLQVVTDGEFRRLMYFNSFFDAVDGIAPSQTVLKFRGDDGSVVEHEGPPAIAGRIRKIDNPAAREAAFLSPLTTRDVKITFPTASFLVLQAVLGAGVGAGGYDTAEEAADALVGVLRELVDETVAAGASYVQFDVSGYLTMASGYFDDIIRKKGIDVPSLLSKMIEADQRVVRGLPDHVTTCLHQCRGNYASRYVSTHDQLGELGQTLLSLPYDRFTFEWDGHVERTPADYAALEAVRDTGATVVLGVVSTRHAALETEEHILRTIDKAARHVPMEQLAISPQCGFSSALSANQDERPDGNLITEDVQWKKLELLVNTARKLWGEA